jgi:dynein heavy chain
MLQYFNIVAFLATEIDFWNSRLKNLESIYDQLREQRVKKMASILELTDSAYFPCFKTQFRDIVAGE